MTYLGQEITTQDVTVRNEFQEIKTNYILDSQGNSKLNLTLGKITTNDTFQTPKIETDVIFNKAGQNCIGLADNSHILMNKNVNMNGMQLYNASLLKTNEISANASMTVKFNNTIQMNNLGITGVKYLNGSRATFIHQMNYFVGAVGTFSFNHFVIHPESKEFIVVSNHLHIQHTAAGNAQTLPFTAQWFMLHATQTMLEPDQRTVFVTASTSYAQVLVRSFCTCVELF
ncbi:MAG: hypothetical protein JKY54_06785 [Flavobacteriales bacterium]|nr:hypothetical protein [Flavobacteriales bacterium]